MPLINVRGIVLRTYNLGEKDRIIVLLTPQHGKLRAVAKGARRPGNRFAAAADALVEMDAGIYTGRGLHTLNQAVIITSHRSLRERLDYLAHGLFMAELIDLFTVDAEVEPATYDLLSRSLNMLEESTNPALLLAWFECQLLLQMGLLPEAEACAHCGADQHSLAALSLAKGEMLCAGCAAAGGSRLLRLSRETVALLRYLTQQATDGHLPAELNNTAEHGLARVLEQFIFYQLETTPRSYDFLKSMRP
ncbi:MAG: DNA repair protein RecO [Bacillota bacterium]|jgi:DNA repair protein RecO (recombination protein O)